MWEGIMGIAAIITLLFLLYDRDKKRTKRIKSSLRRCCWRFLCKVDRHKWVDKTYRAGEVDLGNLPPEGLPNRICVRCGLKEY